MELATEFDAVVMLTWSDWKTEPRSNRYHYATRFAKELPVLFVQPWAYPGERLRVENTEVPGVEIIHVTQQFGEHEVDEFLVLLRERGIRQPLLWIYNTLHFQHLIEALPRTFRIFHATEDYLSSGKELGMHDENVITSVIRTLSEVDLLVAVTEGVLSSYQQKGGYRGPAAVIENGCDAEFFLALNERIARQRQFSETPTRPIAIYQGAINPRLDFTLLSDVVGMLPEWDFWFCGRADEGIVEWAKLKTNSNVYYFGELDTAALGERMCRATVGLIPFHRDDLMRVSLPLKAYEYVACGLPVVSIPIDALQNETELFTFATSAQEFVSAICAAAKGRSSPELLMQRSDAAKRNSYNERFSEMCEQLVVERRKLVGKQHRLNMVVLYDDRSMHVNTVREHIDAFRLYSQHATYFVPITGKWPLSDGELGLEINLSLFDVLIVHYSVRVSLPDHLSEGFAQQIERHMGLKILFIQDEYDSTETARRWMERLHFDIVYTCVPSEAREFVYPNNRFPGTDFLPTLTGYVPEDEGLDYFVKPMQERTTLIGYRGRQLPYIYGTMGYEKYRIGVDVHRLAEERGLAIDIETDDSKRIYGTGWYKFLGSVRATLGTESGSNVFDFDGTLPKAIQQALKKNPGISFEDIHRNVLAEHEGHVKMNQISPKIFEAIRLRTALVLFEGGYSGVVEAGIHYIPLKKDYSNIDEVFSKLQDIDYLNALTKRAYDDVIGSGKYSYRSFVEGVVRDINVRVIRDARYELFATPVIVRDQHGEIKAVLPTNPLGYSLSSLPLGGNLQREQVASLLSTNVKLSAKSKKRKNGRPSVVNRAARRAWRMLPDSLRTYVNTRFRKTGLE